MNFNAFPQNKILAKIFEFTVSLTLQNVGKILILIASLTNKGSGKSECVSRLWLWANSPDPLLLAYTMYGCRWRLRPIFIPLALVDVPAWAITRGICHKYQNLMHWRIIEITLISYLSYKLHCCTLPIKRCLSHGMCLYQVMMMLHFSNDVTNDTESTQKSKITS